MKAVRAVSQDVVRPREPQAILESIVAHAVELFRGDGGGMYLVVAGARQVRCVVSQNTFGTFVGTILKYGEGAAGIVAESGGPINIPDYRSWEHRARVFEKKAPFRAVISAPMIWQGQVMGVIHVLRYETGKTFDSNALDLLTVFADQAAGVLENARLLESAERRFRQLSQLHQLTRAGLAAADMVGLTRELAEGLGLADRGGRMLPDSMGRAPAGDHPPGSLGPLP